MWRLIGTLILCLLPVVAHAQLPMNVQIPILDASQTAFLCPGIPVHLTAPNDMTNAAWSVDGVVTRNANSQTDPFGGSTAGDMTAGTTGFTGVTQLVAMSINTTYSVSGYFKSSVAPRWLYLQFGDNIANAWGSVFDFLNGTVHNNGSTCNNIISVGNGWFRFSFSGSTAAINNGMGGMRFAAHMINSSDGSTLSATIGQEFFYYIVGP